MVIKIFQYLNQLNKTIMIILIFLISLVFTFSCCGASTDNSTIDKNNNGEVTNNNSSDNDDGDDVVINNTIDTNENYDYPNDTEAEESGGVTRDNSYLEEDGGDSMDEYIDEGTAGETYEDYGINPEIETSVNNISTFSIDVDTGSYTVARRYLMDNNKLPPEESVRAEEFINYFDYNYIIPEDAVFAIQTDIAPSLFREGKHTLRVGVQGKDVPPEERKRANLVFLIDISGSMRPSNKLPLIKESLKFLLEQLDEDDMVGIAVYAGVAEPYLESTPISQKDVIIEAIDNLDANGTTNAEGGIRIAYEMASENYFENGINRVILCSDGDANVGNISPDELISIVDGYRELGITLSTFGFGMGNYNDTFMEQLANKGDGNYGYIDSLDEARRIFGKKLVSILQVIARDVKIQVVFDKNTVKKYRLIGYENRKLETEDFRDDTVDAGEVGALHSVTAIYEITLYDGYEDRGENLYELRLRWKDDKGQNVTEGNTMLSVHKVRDNIMDTSPYYRLAISVSEFAEILRGSPYAQGSNFETLIEVVTRALTELEVADDKFYELLELIEKAEYLKGSEVK